MALSYRRRIWLQRALLGVAIVIATAAGAFTIQQRLCQQASAHFLDDEFTDHLKLIFSNELFGDPIAGIVMDRLEIANRAKSINAHLLTRGVLESAESCQCEVWIASIAGIIVADKEIGDDYRYHLRLPGVNQPVGVDVWMKSTVNINYPAWGVGLTGALLFPLLLARYLPVPAAIHRFPLAQYMAILFDRKISANRVWGCWRLSHLGGGGTLPGLETNTFLKANDTQARQQGISAVTNTYQLLKPLIRATLEDGARWQSFSNVMADGLAAAEKRVVLEAPTVHSEQDVWHRFIPFIREDALAFATINLADANKIAHQLGIPVSRCKVAPSPGWLLGGMEVYYPRVFFTQLLDEIRAGLTSEYGREIDRVSVTANAERPFINVDLISENLEISIDGYQRIASYLHKPYPGGLNNICQLLEGFGELFLMDRQWCINLTYKSVSKSVTGCDFTWRLAFRRVFPGPETELTRRWFEALQEKMQ